MSNSQNEFYSSISNYYSEIFPYKPAQLEFVQNQVGQLKGAKILDIGCATGELSSRLAEQGAEVTGIDLNPDLITQAKNSKKHSGLLFQIGDMLKLTDDFPPNSFDAVLCFGNTLVHLLSAENILKMAQGVYQILKPEGKFLLQILNYDYILDKQVTKLPLIETENIRFVRNYNFEESSPVITFQTELVLKKENRSVKNETPLLALRHEKLKRLLGQAGFKNTDFFASFKKESFGGEHLPLVVYAEK